MSPRLSTARPATVTSPTGTERTVFGASRPGKFRDQPGLIASVAVGRVYVTQGFNRIDGPWVLISIPAAS